MPAFNAQGGMPYWIDLNTPEPEAAARFYTGLLNWQVNEEVEGSGYLVARVQGLPVAGLIPATGGATTWVTYFLADDLEAQLDRIGELGGTVLAGPTDAQIGRMGVAADPNGALFGLVEPRGEDAFVAGGEPGCAVWHELTCTSGFDKALDFYTGLFGWQSATVGGEGTDLPRYGTLLADSAPFAGLRDAAGHFPEGVPGFWQTFLGVLDVDTAAARVPELGGEVIQGPFDAEFGRLLIIADPTGATVTLCEVEEYEELDIQEGNDVFEALRAQGLG
ncbi:glyoxalase [Corynebacterium frankenforstense DSM 45800]|uniref:Glyoxalase n=1 Tax=Corynebacterium frankenforstense DSM 45800 TaxID=1437875 RepID=A0A1L7CQF3_9CORY|nr:VOC family protein [Corynebacterium frankenforstense]APT88057.1 glyoxalase [Corynebacterium frankenforstense DSM 45800]